jgi:hypothetical protein
LATAEVDIVNSALIKLGDETISSLSDSNKRARLANEQYDKCRREVLSAHPWNFALKRVQLSQNATAPAFGFTYRYDVPADNLRIWRVWNSANDDDDHEIHRWKVENGYVLTDEAAVYALYIYNCEDVTLFEAKFEEMLALRLAADLCEALTQRRSKANDLMSAYKEWEKEARSMDGQVGTPDPVIEGDWLSHRVNSDSPWS